MADNVPHNPPHPPRAYRVRTFTQITGIGRTRTFELLKSGVLESIKVGRSRLILADSVEKLLRGE